MDIRDKMLKSLNYWKYITEKNINELQSMNEDLDIKIEEIEKGISHPNQLKNDKNHEELINLQNDIYFEIHHLKRRLIMLNKLIKFEKINS